MTCNNPSGDSHGILVAWQDQPPDDGVRPLPTSDAYWTSPNIRLAAPNDVAGFTDPGNANWDSPWDGHVNVGTAYTLLVRVRNTDSTVRAAPLHLNGWVSDYTAGGVGPASAILDSSGNPIQFVGADDTTDLQPGGMVV